MTPVKTAGLRKNMTSSPLSLWINAVLLGADLVEEKFVSGKKTLKDAFLQ